MLKKKYRLNLSIRLDNPELLKNSFFTLLVSKNSLQISRFGFIASKKNDKRAVYRNKIKRIFARCLRKEKIKIGYDMIFIIKKEAFDKQEETICQSIQNTLKKGSFYE